MMLRRYARTLLFASASLGLLMLPACSAVLDIDSLEQGKDGLELDQTKPYDMSGTGSLLRPVTRKRLALAEGQSGELMFRWRNQPGRPARVDLSVDATFDDRAPVGPSATVGQPLVQVFSRQRKPYARLGLTVVPLREGQAYRLAYRRRAGKLIFELRAALPPEGTRALATSRVDASAALRLTLSRASFASRIALLAWPVRRLSTPRISTPTPLAGL